MLKTFFRRGNYVLILLTVKILIQKENTEGIKDWQTTAATNESLEKIG